MREYGNIIIYLGSRYSRLINEETLRDGLKEYEVVDMKRSVDFEIWNKQ